MPRKKFNIEDHIPPIEADTPCDRCEAVGTSREFAGEWLCIQCQVNDVFSDMNDRNE